MHHIFNYLNIRGFLDYLNQLSAYNTVPHLYAGDTIMLLRAADGHIQHSREL